MRKNQNPLETDLKGQTQQHFLDSGKEKISVVTTKGQIEFRDIKEFRKHFENNIEDYREISKQMNPEYFVLIDGKPFVGFIGVSKDMDLSTRKAGLSARKSGVNSGFLLRKVVKSGDDYIGTMVYRIKQ